MPPGAIRIPDAGSCAIRTRTSATHAAAQQWLLIPLRELVGGERDLVKQLEQHKAPRRQPEGVGDQQARDLEVDARGTKDVRVPRLETVSVDRAIHLRDEFKKGDGEA